MQRRFTMKREAGTRGRSPSLPLAAPLPGMHPALMAYDLEVIARECAGESDRPPLLFVHSLGGLIVQKYLEAREAPAAVLLAPPSVRGLLGSALRTLREHPWLSLQALLSGTPRRLFATPELVSKFFFSPELGEEQVREYAARMGSESLLALLQLIYTRPDRARIRSASLLVLGAARDYFIGPPAIRRTAEAYDAEALVLPGVAHDLMLDAGWRQAAEAMLEWLQRTLEPEARAGADQ